MSKNIVTVDEFGAVKIGEVAITSPSQVNYIINYIKDKNGKLILEIDYCPRKIGDNIIKILKYKYDKNGHLIGKGVVGSSDIYEKGIESKYMDASTEDFKSFVEYDDDGKVLKQYQFMPNESIYATTQYEYESRKHFDATIKTTTYRDPHIVPTRDIIEVQYFMTHNTEDDLMDESKFDRLDIKSRTKTHQIFSDSNDEESKFITVFTKSEEYEYTESGPVLDSITKKVFNPETGEITEKHYTQSEYHNDSRYKFELVSEHLISNRTENRIDTSCYSSTDNKRYTVRLLDIVGTHHIKFASKCYEDHITVLKHFFDKDNDAFYQHCTKFCRVGAKFFDECDKTSSTHGVRHYHVLHYSDGEVIHYFMMLGADAKYRIEVKCSNSKSEGVYKLNAIVHLFEPLTPEDISVMDSNIRVFINNIDKRIGMFDDKYHHIILKTVEILVKDFNTSPFVTILYTGDGNIRSIYAKHGIKNYFGDIDYDVEAIAESYDNPCNGNIIYRKGYVDGTETLDTMFTFTGIDPTSYNNGSLYQTILDIFADNLSDDLFGQNVVEYNIIQKNNTSLNMFEIIYDMFYTHISINVVEKYGRRDAKENVQSEE